MRLIEASGYQSRQTVGILDMIQYLDEPYRVNRWDRLNAAEMAAVETEIAKCRASFSYAARNYFQMVTKQKEDVYFSLWPGQELILRSFQELMDAGKPPRLLIMKARQLGASTLIEAIMAWLTVFYRNNNCLVVSYDIPHTAYLFSLMQNFYDLLPWWLKPKSSARERKSNLQFQNPDVESRRLDPGLNSMIMTAPANAVSGVGRGFRFNGFHGSEISKWKDRAEEIIEAQIKNALVEDITTIAALEGTPEGAGTYFHNLWKQMVALGEDAYWAPKYYPWMMEPTRVIAPKQGWKPQEEELLIRDAVQMDWVKCQEANCGHVNERFRLSVDTSGTTCVRCSVGVYLPMVLTDAQLAWHEKEWKNAQAKPESMRMFRQEMSSTAAQAWQLSGNPVFSDAAVEWVNYTVKPPLITGHFDKQDNFHGWNWRTNKCVFKSCDKNHQWDDKKVEIWEFPTRGASYYIGADISLGIGQDYSVANVIRIGVGASADVQVAKFRSNTIDPIKYAYVLKSLGKFYNEAEIALEVDKFDSAATYLRDSLMYPRTYVNRNSDSTGYVGKTGWRTSGKAKNNLISHMMRWLDSKSVVVRSQNLVDEIKTFQRDKDNPDKIQAADGSFDDDIMAFMIALYCAREHQVDSRLGYVPLMEPLTMDNAQYVVKCKVCGTRTPCANPQQFHRCQNQSCGSIRVEFINTTRIAPKMSEWENELFGNEVKEGDGIHSYADYIQ